MRVIDMTDEALTGERNLFLGTAAALVVPGIPFRIFWASMTPAAQDIAVLMTIVAKLVFVCLVFRLSRILRHPALLTAVYCILAPLAVLYAIPFVGLLVGVRNARAKLSSPNHESAGGVTPPRSEIMLA